MARTELLQSLPGAAKIHESERFALLGGTPQARPSSSVRAAVARSFARSRFANRGSEVFIEVPAIYTGQTFFMSHHLTKTDCATFILKDTQCAGLCREDCEINGDAFAANGIFQKNMSVYQTVASRLRCAGENRPIRSCGCRKREKEKDTFKTHELYGPPVLDAGCRLRMLPAAMLYHRISAAASENADRSVTDPKWDLLSGPER